MANFRQATSARRGTSASEGRFWRRFIAVEEVMEEVTSAWLSDWFEIVIFYWRRWRRLFAERCRKWGLPACAARNTGCFRLLLKNEV
jgi:hypothetical protein